MTHFKVLVIGADVEGQLEPYDENLAVDLYRDDTVNVSEQLAEARAFYERLDEPREGLDLSSDEAVLAAWMGGEVRRGDYGALEYWTHSNPEGWWDWWSIGGRFSGELQLKGSGAGVDEATKEEIDFEGMTAEYVRAAEEQWGQMLAATEGLTPPDRSWKELLSQMGGDAEAAREVWHSNAWVKEAGKGMFFADPYEVYEQGASDPRAEFMRRAKARAFTGFCAIVKDGQWHQEARVGWWGMSFDEMPADEWEALARSLIEQAGDDETFTVVDCHI